LASKGKGTTDASPPSNSNLPKSWNTVRFGDVVRDVNESERNPLDAGLERYVGLEHIEPENLHIKQWGMLADSEISFRKRFRKGQVLFGKRRAYQRKVAVAEFDGICSSDILTFEPKGDALIPELLPFIVQSEGFFEHALGTSSGSLSPRTRWSQLQDYEFPLPPKDEQRRIADILWAADDSCEAWRSVAAHASQAFNLLLDDLMSGGNSHKKEFSTWFEPQGWKLKTVGDLVDFQGGSQPPRDTFEYSPREGNIRLIQIRDYKSDEFATYIPTELARRFCTREDVMIGRYGPPIFQILKGIEGSYNVALIKAIPKGEISKDYLYYFLKQGPLFRLVEHLSQRSSGQTGVDMEALRKFPFPLPPVNLQMQILDILHKAEQVIVDLNEHIKRQKQLSNQFFTSALTCGGQNV
jgi:type I restriction enzyme S subunit